MSNLTQKSQISQKPDYLNGYFDASIGLAPKTKITPSILENQTEKGF